MLYMRNAKNDMRKLARHQQPRLKRQREINDVLKLTRCTQDKGNQSKEIPKLLECVFSPSLPKLSKLRFRSHCFPGFCCHISSKDNEDTLTTHMFMPKRNCAGVCFLGYRAATNVIHFMVDTARKIFTRHGQLLVL